MSEMRLYPGWKEAVERISVQEPGWFVSDEQLEEWIGEEKGTEKFNLDMLNMREMLLWVYQIHLRRTEQDNEKGYVIDSDQDKTDGYVEKLQERIRSTIRRQAHVLVGVNPANLTDDGVRKHEHQIRRAGHQQAFHALIEARSKNLPESITFKLGDGNKEEDKKP